MLTGGITPAPKPVAVQPEVAKTNKEEVGSFGD
jgi:hypothetical protein